MKGFKNGKMVENDRKGQKKQKRTGKVEQRK